MKTDKRGGASADSKLEARLTARFAAELRRAERDYPALEPKLQEAAAAAGAGSGRAKRSGGIWPRLIALPVAAVALAIVAVALSPLLFPATTPPVVPGPSASGPSASGLTFGSDGVPLTVDGERVYRAADRASFPDDSFLLGGRLTTPDFVPPCPMRVDVTTAEASLVPYCWWVSIDGLAVAPTSIDLSNLRNFVIVARVHTHDSLAAQCPAGERAACESALVAQALVWPVVPAELNGERVFRVDDAGGWPTSGSFLLGGLVRLPAVDPICFFGAQFTESEGKLLTQCGWAAIDSLRVAPMGIDLLKGYRGHFVVARVHQHDQLALECSPGRQTACELAVVVESIVWDAGPAGGPTAAPSTTLPPVGPSVSLPVPPPSIPLGPDGVPTSLSGQVVYRADDLPAPSKSFYLGGKLTRDQGCAPTAPLAKPPACGYWMIDGIRVGTQVAIPETLLGRPVVASVRLSESLAICAGESCLETTIVVLGIDWPVVVWPPIEDASPPPPPLPSPS